MIIEKKIYITETSCELLNHKLPCVAYPARSNIICNPYTSDGALKAWIIEKEIRSDNGALVVINGREVIFVDELLNFLNSEK